jgi:hypothetical protein
MLECFDEEYVNKKNQLSQRYNLKIPDFEAEDHWPTMIQFLGPPYLQSTKFWENYNLVMKEFRTVINHQNEERDILHNVHHFIHMILKYL